MLLARRTIVVRVLFPRGRRTNRIYCGVSKSYFTSSSCLRETGTTHFPPATRYYLQVRSALAAGTHLQENLYQEKNPGENRILRYLALRLSDGGLGTRHPSFIATQFLFARWQRIG